MDSPALHDVLPPVGSDPLEVVMAIADWSEARHQPLYPHQEQAAMALAAGDHVVLATPTGSGKSLVAMIGVALTLNAGGRAVWTAPIKALVAEKFFDLVGLFGAPTVGLATGDATINADAAVLVCTAEVLANRALAGHDDVDFACLDEFHYYADRDRGWAWQVPLLEMERCQFLLASATLGDMSIITDDLTARTDRTVSQVTSVDRPTPLHHQWRMTPVAESVSAAVGDGLSPVYVVHSTQADAITRAQALVSVALTTREQREQIAAAMAGVPMNTGFAKTLARLMRNGVGVHHAGMLPRHRRLVERLAGEGLLPVICGTDTLGVGVNIPIRTVVMTALTKFDGNRTRVFTAREFHQLAGRAGRPGFDPDGHIWVQAPEHVIENERALAKAGDDPKAQRRVKRAKPPDGFVHYDQTTMDRLVAAAPEPLSSRFTVTPDLVATVLSRPDGPGSLKRLLSINHDPPARQRTHRRRAIAVYRSLEAAGVAERHRDDQGRCTGVSIGSVVLGDQERSAMRFSSALTPFAVEVIATLDPSDPGYVLDVVSVIESILDDPRQILYAQRDRARTAAIAQMKADGVDYDERIERLDSVTYPRPLADFIEACFETYRGHHRWVHTSPSPKSIVREMLENGDTFATFTGRYALARSEGLVLRYLSDAWRTLDRSLVDAAYVEGIEDIIEWLATLIRATDSTLMDEWQQLTVLASTGVIGRSRGDPAHTGTDPEAPSVAAGPPPAWRTTLRTAVFRWVELLAARSYQRLAEQLAAHIPTTTWTAEALSTALAPYWLAHDHIGIDTDARALFTLREHDQRWEITQILADPERTGEWRLVIEVDLEASATAGAPVMDLIALGSAADHP